ncbi:MAG: hypothetical protein HY706_01015 [Candidatus Hydrogenedentes bacterium]|nr:hypothetical protein [Candidatus Hydrogenedentota bacterium]
MRGNPTQLSQVIPEMSNEDRGLKSLLLMWVIITMTTGIGGYLISNVLVRYLVSGGI